MPAVTADRYRAQLDVRFGDIDQAGIVYYPRFVHYFHVAMEHFFRDRVGIDYARVLNEHRLGHPTVHLDVDFRKPLRYGDRLEIEVGVESIGRTSVGWRYRVFRPGEPEPAATARIVTVNLDLDSFEKVEVPDWLRTKLDENRVAVAS